MTASSVILMYHSLDPSGSVISLHPDVFGRQMEALAESGVAVVPLAKAIAVPGSVAITFDDGFRNFLDAAVPALRQYRFPATVFVVSGHCGRRNDWPTQARGLPSLPLMDGSGLKEAASAGVEIGAHTVHHPRLAELPAPVAEQEMRDCRTALEERTGSTVESLAYPNGISNRLLRSLAARHFRRACGTNLRTADAGSDPFDLPRIDVYYLRDLARFRSVISGRSGGYLAVRRTLRAMRRIL
jgi:peptidoglycan/xylan/chitin deacetylase (PgdA/CDA1 family)